MDSNPELNGPASGGGSVPPFSGYNHQLLAPYSTPSQLPPSNGYGYLPLPPHLQQSIGTPSGTAQSPSPNLSANWGQINNAIPAAAIPQENPSANISGAPGMTAPMPFAPSALYDPAGFPPIIYPFYPGFGPNFPFGLPPATTDSSTSPARVISPALPAGLSLYPAGNHHSVPASSAALGTSNPYAQFPTSFPMFPGKYDSIPPQNKEITAQSTGIEPEGAMDIPISSVLLEPQSTLTKEQSSYSTGQSININVHGGATIIPDNSQLTGVVDQNVVVDIEAETLGPQAFPKDLRASDQSSLDGHKNSSIGMKLPGLEEHGAKLRLQDINPVTSFNLTAEQLSQLIRNTIKEELQSNTIKENCQQEKASVTISQAEVDIGSPSFDNCQKSQRPPLVERKSTRGMSNNSQTRACQIPSQKRENEKHQMLFSCDEVRCYSCKAPNKNHNEHKNPKASRPRYSSAEQIPYPKTPTIDRGSMRSLTTPFQPYPTTSVDLDSSEPETATSAYAFLSYLKSHYSEPIGNELHSHFLEFVDPKYMGESDRDIASGTQVAQDKHGSSEDESVSDECEGAGNPVFNPGIVATSASTQLGNHPTFPAQTPTYAKATEQQKPDYVRDIQGLIQKWESDAAARNDPRISQELRSALRSLGLPIANTSSSDSDTQFDLHQNTSNRDEKSGRLKNSKANKQRAESWDIASSSSDEQFHQKQATFTAAILGSRNAKVEDWESEEGSSTKGESGQGFMKDAELKKAKSTTSREYSRREAEQRMSKAKTHDHTSRSSGISKDVHGDGRSERISNKSSQSSADMETKKARSQQMKSRTSRALTMTQILEELPQFSESDDSEVTRAILEEDARLVRSQATPEKDFKRMPRNAKSTMQGKNMPKNIDLFLYEPDAASLSNLEARTTSHSSNFSAQRVTGDLKQTRVCSRKNSRPREFEPLQRKLHQYTGNNRCELENMSETTKVEPALSPAGLSKFSDCLRPMPGIFPKDEPETLQGLSMSKHPRKYGADEEVTSALSSYVTAMEGMNISDHGLKDKTGRSELEAAYERKSIRNSLVTPEEGSGRKKRAIGAVDVPRWIGSLQ